MSTSQAVPSTSLVQSVRKEPKGPMATQYTANITTAKMGRARIRLVTIWSILSEVERRCFSPCFLTDLLTRPLMYAYRWLVMMLSASSSSSFSQSTMWSSRWARRSALRFRSARTFSSRSKTFTAYQRR